MSIQQVATRLVVADGRAAAAFYEAAFGAEGIHLMPGPGGEGILHGEFTIAGTRFALADMVPPESYVRTPAMLSGTSVSCLLEVADAGLAVERALAAGATEDVALHDTFWGARYARVKDPFGHVWEINQTVEVFDPDKARVLMEEAFAAEA